MIRADDNCVLIKGIEISLFDGLLERPGFQNHRGQEKFIGKFLIPLLAERSRNNDEQFAPLFRPLLRKENPSLDCFSKPDLIRQDRPF